ncbi:type VII toxin-antitoxin system MntA family adenylyltransferase antitoxin [Natronospora cellulosivora (SeqCode)]
MRIGQKEVPLDIIKKYKIKLLVLFGSYADNSNKPDSDLDLAYISEDLLNKDEELSLLHDLISFYQKGELDVVDLTKASPTLKLEVANKGKLLYGSGEEFLKFQLYAASRFADSKFLRIDRENYLKERLSKL